MPINIFEGYETRDVKGTDVATPEELCNALGIQRVQGASDNITLPPDSPLRQLPNKPGLSWRDDGYLGGKQVTGMQLSWPLWFVGTITYGKIVVGETLYEAPGPLHIPAVQNFVIVEPITFVGRLRTRRNEP